MQVFIALKLQLFSYVFKIAITKLVVIRMWNGIGRNMLYSCHLSYAILDCFVFCRFWKWYWTQWLTIKKYWRTPRAFCNDGFLASAWFMLLFFMQIFTNKVEAGDFEDIYVSILLSPIRTLRYTGFYWSVISIICVWGRQVTPRTPPPPPSSFSFLVTFKENSFFFLG